MCGTVLATPSCQGWSQLPKTSKNWHLSPHSPRMHWAVLTNCEFILNLRSLMKELHSWCWQYLLAPFLTISEVSTMWKMPFCSYPVATVIVSTPACTLPTLAVHQYPKWYPSFPETTELKGLLHLIIQAQESDLRPSSDLPGTFYFRTISISSSCSQKLPQT